MGIFDSFKKKRPDNSSREMKPETPPQQPRAAHRRRQVGDRIQNRYEIRDIKYGGMGIVYICYDHKSGEPVAIKTFQDKFLQDRATISRFKWEAEAWVRLEKHYNIVQAMYVDEIEGRPYIFLEYVVGDEQYGADLSGWIWGGGLTRDGKADTPLILNFAIQFCHGMIHAEGKFLETRKPFVHRDIKPSNIMITKDRIVKITDFGLVKAFADSHYDMPSVISGTESRQRLGLSKSGSICGTPPYLSPEQCRGENDIDITSDIYSFGCVLYEMITRSPPFDAQNLEGYIRHHLNTIPESPKTDNDLDYVVLRCLEKDPQKRYRDFVELEEDLFKIYWELTDDVIQPPEAEALNAWELNNKGVSLAHLGFHGEAVACYREALRLNPNLTEGHYNLGNAYCAQGKLNEAVGEYREALRLNPGYVEAHYNLGNAYIKQGKLSEAVGEYREAVRLNPNLTEGHYNLGNAYRDQGRHKEAIESY